MHNGRPSVSPPGAGVPPLIHLDICWTTGWSLRPGKPVGELDGAGRAVPGADWLGEFAESSGGEATIRAGTQPREPRETLIALVGSCAPRRPLAGVRAWLS